MRKKKEVGHKYEDNIGFFILAGIFMGLGVGGFYGHWVAGFLLGLGIGFLLMAIFKLLKK